MNQNLYFSFFLNFNFCLVLFDHLQQLIVLFCPEKLQFQVKKQKIGENEDLKKKEKFNKKNKKSIFL
jgi:hypothetical protein